MRKRLSENAAYRADVEVNIRRVQCGQAVLRIRLHLSVLAKQSRTFLRRNDTIIEHGDIPNLTILRHRTEKETAHEWR